MGLYPADRGPDDPLQPAAQGHVAPDPVQEGEPGFLTGDKVATPDIVNGFPLGGGEYIVVTRDELKEAAPGKSETIEISDFVDLGEIDPVHFRQTYYLAPRGKVQTAPTHCSGRRWTRPAR